MKSIIVFTNKYQKLFNVNASGNVFLMMQKSLAPSINSRKGNNRRRVMTEAFDSE